MAYKSRRERRADGGKANGGTHQYNAVGSPEEKEEKAKTDGFKRGGRKERAHGGMVDGKKAKHHLGKRARGGECEERARGGGLRGHGLNKGRAGNSPWSSGHAAGERPESSKNMDTGPGESAEDE